MQTVSTFFTLNFNQRFLLVEATVLTALARFAVLTLPFRVISRIFGLQSTETPDEVDAKKHPLLKSVRWALSATSNRVPWNANCLAQAIAATIMLRRRGGEGTVYFGVLKDEQGQCKGTRLGQKW